MSKLNLFGTWDSNSFLENRWKPAPMPQSTFDGSSVLSPYFQAYP